MSDFSHSEPYLASQPRYLHLVLMGSLLGQLSGSCILANCEVTSLYSPALVHQAVSGPVGAALAIVGGIGGIGGIGGACATGATGGGGGGGGATGGGAAGAGVGAGALVLVLVLVLVVL